MPSSITAVSEIQTTPALFKSARTTEVDSVENNLMQVLKNRFVDKGEYENKRDKLLGFLNNILRKTYSFGPNGLPIESIFNENSFVNNDKICNAGKKAYAYYLKEVLQKLNLLNQHILKGQEALNALQTCTDEDQIENYKTILEIQDEIVKKYLDDFNNYTVVQTLSTTRRTIRNTIDNKPAGIPSTDSVEINYATRGKIWGENGIGETNFQNQLNALDSPQALRSLTTVKETGFQSIITTLTNKRTGSITNLNDEFGFNVVEKNINIISSDSSPIALFDELTLLEKLKYIHVYYHNRNGYPYEFYHYPEDLKSGVPCMSRAELEKFVHDTNTSVKEGDPEGNDDELEALGIIPSDANKPKADLVEPGAIELFYVGYLKDSMGTINALAAFMEIKSVSLMSQITQQSYRIKALKTYLKMLEFGLQELNNSFKGTNAISTKAYLAIKYAAVNQTRTLVNINGEDYIVMQVDGNKETGNYEHYNLSDNNTYIYVKATTEGIQDFLNLQWEGVDAIFNPTQKENRAFTSLSNPEIVSAYSENKQYCYRRFDDEIEDYQYLHKKAFFGEYYTIDIERYDDGEINRYQHESAFGKTWYINTRGHTPYLYEKDVATADHRLIYNPDLGWTADLGILGSIEYFYIYYKKITSMNPENLAPENNNVLFAEFNDKAEAIEHIPKELETSKVKMDELLKNFGNTSLNWRNATLTEDEIKDGIKREEIWPKFVETWQNVCQTAIENIGSQIESVNKTIKSLRSKIDTFDSSANRFRDKFYSTTMTVLNKLS